MNENNLHNVLRYIRTHIPYNDKVRLTMSQLAELSGVSISYIGFIENPNKKLIPPRHTLEKIATGISEALNLKKMYYIKLY